MKNYRLWGKPPNKVVVVHGGPGAPGSMAPVARELSKDFGVMELLETASTVQGQIEELANVLNTQGELPVIIVGWSWGAALSYMTTAKHPELVKKLVLIGTSPVLARKGARPDPLPIYLERFTEVEKAEFFRLVSNLRDEKTKDKNAEFGKLCRVIGNAEIFEPIPAKDDVIEYQFDINQAIGQELNKLILGRTLIEAGKKIECPVVAIQGDFDSNIAEELRDALSSVIKNFKFILLNKCGHSPWVEKYARDEFFKAMREEIILWL